MVTCVYVTASIIHLRNQEWQYHATLHSHHLLQTIESILCIRWLILPQVTVTRVLCSFILHCHTFDKSYFVILSSCRDERQA